MADDQADFAAFYIGARDACLRAVIASGASASLAEDMVADAFAKAWTSWRRVSRHPAPQAWVVRTAVNANISWWRRGRREEPLASVDLVSLDATGVIDPAVIRAIRQLPDRQREVVVLRVVLDLDTDTTAAILGIAPGTVMTHLSRAVAALRCSLSSLSTLEVTP